MILIRNIKLRLEEEESRLKEIVKKKYRIREKDILSFSIYKRSVDARKEVSFIYSVLLSLKEEEKLLRYPDVSVYEEKDLSARKVSSSVRPVIIGYGPSGFFAAWRLSEAGLKPVILERGKRIQEREKDVESFFKGGPFNKEDNVAYGEGGAGTFSDAKFTTRVNDPFVSYILKTFIEHGTEERIAVDAHAHVGTDRIRKVIASMTDELIKRGCEFHFGEAVRDFLIEDGRLKAVITDKDTYYSDFFLLGIGHSARDTFEKLYERGAEIIRKDTAIGFRVEHPQSLIDGVQYKGLISEKLEPSEYFLRYKDEKGVYSFCMCPGGFVVPSNAEEGHIVTNGMSYSERDNELANSAILIQARKEEYGEGPLSGFDYLETYERKAYEITSSYRAPAMNISDFMKGELHPLIFPSSYPLGTVLYDLSSFYKEEDVAILRKALSFFDEKIPGFIEKGIMVAPESRSLLPCPHPEKGRRRSGKREKPLSDGRRTGLWRRHHVLCSGRDPDSGQDPEEALITNSLKVHIGFYNRV